MHWRAASEPQHEARWRVFMMFVAMALLIIRTGLVSRGVIAILPVENTPQDATQAPDPEPSSTSPDDLSRATLVLLCLAEAAGRLIIVKEGAAWELMNQPPPRSLRRRPLRAAICTNARHNASTRPDFRRGQDAFKTA